MSIDWTDKNSVLEELKTMNMWQLGASIRSIDNKIFNDKDIALYFVSKDGMFLQYLNEINKDDEEIVLKAIEENQESIQYASDRIKENPEFYLSMIEKGYHFLVYSAPDSILSNEDIVLASLRKNGHGIRGLNYRNSPFYYELKFTIEALKQDKKVFDFIHEKLKNNPEILKLINS